MPVLLEEIIISEVMHAQYAGALVEFQDVVERIKGIFPTEGVTDGEIELALVNAAAARKVGVSLSRAA
ncbi:hypothetical protein K32_13010 [Kaistia sp. 32K]|uniref:hypothetical protein n=1 Tax=Kaistia sp. 32K TaxID=2795690 RepID=UPI001916883B|nr:hypothetical protein [Kaistia sp. 32K]BCP52684.1 hypothetical protein K32_13010 [Kaistia sp. 32K]